MHKTLLIIVIGICISVSAAAFAAEGNLDPSFGQAGEVTFNKGAGSSAEAAVLQPDGKKIIVGTVPGSSNSDILVLRLNPDGTRDTSFGASGVVIFTGPPDASDSAAGVALQSDGRIVVAGQRSNGTDIDILVFRLRADGTLDASFRGSGSAQYDLGGNESAGGVALQSDGRIVLAGTASNAADNDILIMRLTSAGLLDLSFGSNGVFRYDGGGDEAGNAVAIQTDGRIVAAGQSSNGADPDIIVLRVTVSGIADNTLSGTGARLIDRGGRDIGNAVAVQTNGKIVVTGLSSNGVDADLIVVRLNPDGVLDTTFNVNGIFVLEGVAGGRDAGNAVAIQTNGKIVVTGSSSNGVNADVIVVRLNPDGIRDVTFSGNGTVRYHASALGDAAGNAICAQPDGMILAAGFGSNGLNSYVLVLRLDANGVLDTTFNATGVVTFRKKVNTADVGNAVTVQPDGSIVVIGQTSQGADNDVLALRYRSDGRRAASFSGDGVAVFGGSAGGEDIGRAVALQADGMIVVAGQTSDGGSNDVLVLRYTSDGTLDSAFNGDGTTVYNGTANNEDIGRAVAVQADGKIVVVGQTSNGTNNNLLVLRYDSNGTLDSTFGTGGAVTFGGGSGASGRAVAIQPDGMIVAAGVTSNGTDSDLLLVRFDANGSPDAAFGAGGAVTYDSGSDDAARAVALQPDGKIVVTGFRNNGTKNIALIMRFTANGSLDNTFSGDGIIRYNSGSGGDDIGNAVAVQADGKVVVAGTTNGSDVLLLRYRADGTPDPDGAFSGQGVVTFSRGAADAGNALFLQSDGKIVVAGVSDGDVLVLRFIGQNLKLVAPNGGEKLPASSSFNIEWTSPPKAVSFALQFSLDNGVTWSTIAPNVPASPYSWTVPTPRGTKTQCLVRVKGFDVNNAKVGSDQSNAVFTIEPVTLTAPNGGEIFAPGAPVNITWTTHATKDPVAAVKLSYTFNGGATWNPIDTTTDPSDDGSFSWAAPSVTAKKRARVKVVLKDSAGKTLGSDASDANFKISPP